MDTKLCECGNVAETAIWNGMFQIAVCHDCWIDPENICVEVGVLAAEEAISLRVPHNVRFDDLPRPIAEYALTTLNEALAARGMPEGDEALAAYFVEYWNEGYAA
jgi:hypothetical protein